MPRKMTVNLTRLGELMGRKHWGISELAKYSKVKYDTVYSIVKGRRQNTTLEIITKLAVALNATPGELIGDGAATTVPKLPAGVQQLADIASNLSEVRQAELIRIAEALRKLEEEQQTLTTPMVATLMELHEKLREQGVTEDALDLLETLIPPPRRLSHTRSRKRPHEPGEQYGGM